MLDALPELKICVAYELDGKQIRRLPSCVSEQAAVKPIYETLPGWRSSTQGARSWAQLPADAIKYIRRVEELVPG